MNKEVYGLLVRDLRGDPKSSEMLRTALYEVTFRRDEFMGVFMDENGEEAEPGVPHTYDSFFAVVLDGQTIGALFLPSPKSDGEAELKEVSRLLDLRLQSPKGIAVGELVSALPRIRWQAFDSSQRHSLSTVAAVLLSRAKENEEHFFTVMYPIYFEEIMEELDIPQDVRGDITQGIAYGILKDNLFNSPKPNN